MNKKEIKKLISEPVSEEQIMNTTLDLLGDEPPSYMDLLLDRSPRIGRAVQLFLSSGYSRAQIGNMLNVQASTVSKWLNIPEVKQYMKEFQKEEAIIIKSRMHASSAAALDKMVKLLDSPIDGVALQAAKDLLDRAGHKPKQEIKKEVTVKSFEERLIELVDIDAEYEEL